MKKADKKWVVNPDGLSISDPNGKVYHTGDLVVNNDGSKILVKSDYEGIDNEELRQYVPDARSWNSLIVEMLNGQSDLPSPINIVLTLIGNFLYTTLFMEDGTILESNGLELPKNGDSLWDITLDKVYLKNNLKLDMKNKSILNLPVPTNNYEAANKLYVDNHSDDSLWEKIVDNVSLKKPGILDMLGSTIINVITPLTDDMVANKEYVDNLVNDLAREFQKLKVEWQHLNMLEKKN